MRIFIHGDAARTRAMAAWCAEHGAFDIVENDKEHMIAEAMLPYEFDGAIVLSDGAKGMEAAMVIRQMYPALPLIWFSDDSAFGAQAYRLQAAYFAQREQAKERLGAALSRAGLV